MNDNHNQHDSNEPETFLESRAAWLQAVFASTLATLITAVVVYPWVELWFDPPAAKRWAPLFFPICFVAMTSMGVGTWSKKRRVPRWLLLPIVSHLLGTVLLFLAWHSVFDWQLLPPLSFRIIWGDITHYAFVGVFTGMWVPGASWVLVHWVQQRVRRRGWRSLLPFFEPR